MCLSPLVCVCLRPCAEDSFGFCVVENGQVRVEADIMGYTDEVAVVRARFAF